MPLCSAAISCRARCLRPFLSTTRMQAMSDAWRQGCPLASILNRSQERPAAEVAAFARGVVGLVPPLQEAFPWLSVTSKLHALAHHAPAFFKRFRSLGSYGEPAFEAWLGWFNHTVADCTADSFLGTCLQFVRRAAMERQPAADVALGKGLHRHSTTGAHNAVRPDDKRLRVNKDSARETTTGKEKELAEMRAWATGCVPKASIVIRAHQARLTKGAAVLDAHMQDDDGEDEVDAATALLLR